MMESLLIVYSAVTAAVAGVLLISLVAGRLWARRRRGRDTVLRSRYLHVVMLALYAGDAEVPRFPMIGRLGARRVLAETIAGVVSVTYGLDTEPLRRIVVAYRLDEWLLRRARWAQGYRRARLLAILAALPEGGQMAAHAGRYARSGNRCVRFQVLMAQLAADPSMALRLIADFADLFSGYELSEIMTLLRRGVLPIAYEPLICSPSRNLRLVGLAVVRQFGIEEAEPLLLRMVAADESSELGREALYTLCAMRRPLAHRQITARVAMMDAAERKALLRYLAQEGYAPEALHLVFDRREYPYYELLVHSYKRSLA